MKHFSASKIFAYNILTLGIYFLVWCNKSRLEINRSAQKELVPKIWILLIPGLNLWWMWGYAEALQIVSYGRIKDSDTFLFFVIGFLVPAAVFGNIAQFLLIIDSSLVSLALIAGLVYLIFQSIGLAFFCYNTQKRINKARR